VKIELDHLPLDDEQTYELFSNGHTIGIFQFSKPKMREYLSRLKPKNISDLAAMNALYRPGPMDLIPDFIDRKYGKKEIQYPHERIEPILKETYGIIVYQEQVMQIVRELPAIRCQSRYSQARYGQKRRKADERTGNRICKRRH
jgi:DNA polymerase-3 subunit alpha